MAIKSDKLDLIFKEFVLLEGAESGEEGLDLGLSIVKRYAQVLNHQVSVSSQEQQGSCFSVQLPAVSLTSSPEGTQALSHAATSSDIRFRGLSVLVVDNMGLVLSSMVGTLTSWGCGVFAARSLCEASKITVSQTIDLIISDFHLGDEEPDGQILIEHHRQLQGHQSAQLPALLMSGGLSGKLEAEAGRYQIGILHKPVRPAVLQHRLLSLLHSPALPIKTG